jgi:hypothetical protein
MVGHSSAPLHSAGCFMTRAPLVGVAWAMPGWQPGGLIGVTPQGPWLLCQMVDVFLRVMSSLLLLGSAA